MSTPSNISGPVLFLDAASPEIRIGVSAAEEPTAIAWRTSPEEAGVSLFEMVDQGLAEAELRVDDLATVVLCEGPGSMLGIRLAAIACRTWQALPRERLLEVFAYRSLELIAAALLADGVAPPFSVIADARRNTWNRLEVRASPERGGIERISSDDLQAQRQGTCFVPASFPRWQPLPPDCQPVEYAPHRLAALIASSHLLLRPCPSPDAFVTQSPTYREWDPNQKPTMPKAQGR